jgi:hypothetical protein
VDTGYGFNILTGEIPVRGFLVETPPMNATNRISLTSFPDSTTCSWELWKQRQCPLLSL